MSIGAVAGIAMVSPASAVTNFNGSCEDTEVCLYQNGGYTGAKADFTGDVSNYVSYNFHGTSTNLNDAVSSVWNLGNWWDITIYEHENYDGAERTIGTNAGLSSIGVLDNEVSSHYW